MAAKRRMIASHLFEDYFFGNLSLLERQLWIGLFATVADDQGRLLDSPIFIRSRVFMYDKDITEAQVEEGLRKLCAAGKITRYSVAGNALIQIVNWWRYQTLAWAVESRYPAPDGWHDRVRYNAPGNKTVSFGWDTPPGYKEAA